MVRLMVESPHANTSKTYTILSIASWQLAFSAFRMAFTRRGKKPHRTNMLQKSLVGVEVLSRKML